MTRLTAPSVSPACPPSAFLWQDSKGLPVSLQLVSGRRGFDGAGGGKMGGGVLGGDPIAVLTIEHSSLEPRAESLC